MKIKVWNIKNRKCISTLIGHQCWVSCLIQLKNGHLASAAFDHSIRIWDLKNNDSIILLTGHSDWVNSIVELKNSNLVSGSADNSIKLWDLNSNKCIKTLNEHNSYIIGIKELEYCKSGDMGYFLIFSGDFTIKLFEFKKCS